MQLSSFTRVVSWSFTGLHRDVWRLLECVLTSWIPSEREPAVWKQWRQQVTTGTRAKQLLTDVRFIENSRYVLRKTFRCYCHILLSQVLRVTTACHWTCSSISYTLCQWQNIIRCFCNFFCLFGDICNIQTKFTYLIPYLLTNLHAYYSVMNVAITLTKLYTI